MTVDTLRADRLPIYGYSKIETPVLDALAREAVVFDRAYTHVPLTLPAHASLFTGRLPFEHGVRDNVRFRLTDDQPTLATELKQVGYTTGAAVSSFVLRAATGIDRGFDFYDDEFAPAGEEANATEIQRRGIETVQRALDWLSRAGSSSVDGDPGDREPVFLFVHLYEPHTPYAPPPHHLPPGRAPYDGEVTYADEILGRLFDGLRRLGLYEPSLIIVLSDHGEALGQHGERDHGVFVYREVMRVPLIVKLPEGGNGGRRIAAPVQIADIAPTILDWVGGGALPGSAGRSLVPALTARGELGDRRIYGESLYGGIHFGWQEIFSLTDRRYSYILAPREELYDLERDPEQLRNLLAPEARGSDPGDRFDPAEVGTEMRDRLLAQMGRSTPRGEELVSAEDAERLRALGYLSSSAGGGGEDAVAPDPKDRIGDLELYRQAVGLQRVHRYALSIERLERVVAGSPRMVDAWDEMAVALRRAGRDEAAVEALRQSLEIDPRRPRQLLKLADLLVDLGRFDAARVPIETASKLAPGEAYLRLALLEVGDGDPEAARRAAAQAGRTVPGAAHFVAGVLLHRQARFEATLRQLQRLSEVNDNPADLAKMPHLHFYLGDAMARVGATLEASERDELWQAADRHLLEELRRHPGSGRALIGLCSLYGELDRVAQCDRVVQHFAVRNPSEKGYTVAAAACDAAGLSQQAEGWRTRLRQLSTARPQPASGDPGRTR